MVRFFFFFNDTATTEIYTLSLHDALPGLDAVARHAGAALDHGRALHVPRQPGHGGVRGLSRRVRESRAAAGQPADPVSHGRAHDFRRAAGVPEDELSAAVLKRAGVWE